jgi:hypothetical protein
MRTGIHPRIKSEGMLRSKTLKGSNDRVPAARCARVLLETLSLQRQRAQGKPGARCTRGLACKMHIRTRTRAYRFSGGNPAFPAQWFTACFALSPVTGLSCHRRRADTSAQLDASVGASGPHDFAVRFSIVRLRTIGAPTLLRPPHPTARFVTIASRPSFG